MKLPLVVALIAVIAGDAAAQPRADTDVTTPTGHDVSVSVGHYTYIEPLATRISIHGFRIGGEYIGTLSLNQRRHWFARASIRGNGGTTRYDGWCRPWLIRPSSSSPNGYGLGLGSPSPCSETGDPDGYVEARGLVGKDLVVRKWGVAAETGIAVRYLSNGTAGGAGFRTDTYLYVPLGVTARAHLAQRVVTFRAEYDELVRGWQTTRQSKLGGGQIPATADAPAFTIDGFTDLSFAQHRGWALRAGAKYPVSKRWYVEPSYVHWHVSDSPVSYGTVFFTVNNIRADQPLGAYEPMNVTREWSVSVGLHF